MVARWRVDWSGGQNVGIDGEPTFDDDGAGDPELAGFRHAFFDDQEEAERLVHELQEAGATNVELRRPPSEPYRRLPPPPAEQAFAALTDHAFVVPELVADAGTTPNFRPVQRYLDAAPAGIDVEAAWQISGGRGDGIQVVDIEYGWDLRHEDLVNLVAGGGSQPPPAERHHGTAVLGIVGARDDARGVVGIAPNCRLRASSAGFDGADWNAAGAIHREARRLQGKGVILLEMHEPGPLTPIEPGDDEQEGFVPVEYGEAEFRAIRYATRSGVVVVSAAGNGGVSLDHPAHGGRLSVPRDSGSILVGAGGSGVDARYPARVRHGYSNYGSRVNLQAWGDTVATTGGDAEDYRDLYDGGSTHRCYTGSFAGTSSAAPIVAGAAACLLGILAARGARMTPREIRSLLVRTGTRGRPVDRIGPLPNLTAALSALGVP